MDTEQVATVYLGEWALSSHLVPSTVAEGTNFCMLFYMVILCSTPTRRANCTVVEMDYMCENFERAGEVIFKPYVHVRMGIVWK